MTLISKQSVEEVARRWVDSWKSSDAAAFAANYAETGEYIDHAFQIRRAGREAIARHCEIWLHSVPDFEMQAAEFNVVGSQALFSYVGTGTFVNDLPKMAATGTAFTFQGFIVLTVDESGLIASTEEFYSTGFPHGVPSRAYHFRGSEGSAVQD